MTRQAESKKRFCEEVIRRWNDPGELLPKAFPLLQGRVKVSWFSHNGDQQPLSCCAICFPIENGEGMSAGEQEKTAPVLARSVAVFNDPCGMGMPSKSELTGLRSRGGEAPV